MRSMLALAVTLPIFFGIAACKKNPNWKSQTVTEITVKPQIGEVKIPVSLWEKVIALNTAAIAARKPPVKSNEKSEAKEGSDEVAPETSLEPLKVYLIERNKGVLKGQNTALSFVAGGGELDLGDFVQPLRGSYFMAFEFMPDTVGVDTKVFFLSNSVIRKVGSDRVGSGCNTYFDLTKTFNEAMKHDGFLLNTSDQRDVSALAGTYVFVSTLGGKLHLATLIIKDDGYRALQCRH